MYNKLTGKIFANILDLCSKSHKNSLKLVHINLAKNKIITEEVIKALDSKGEGFIIKVDLKVTTRIQNMAFDDHFCNAILNIKGAKMDLIDENNIISN
jgi:hypothetical protein